MSPQHIGEAVSAIGQEGSAMLRGGVDAWRLFHRVMGSEAGRRRREHWLAPSSTSSAPTSSASDEIRGSRVSAPTALRNVPPEQRLMLAVLEDALGILVAGPRRTTNARTFWDTRNWVLDDDRGWPFSFVNVCEALDIDPARLRRRLAARCAPGMIARGSEVLR
jgi:hypothetical protein